MPGIVPHSRLQLAGRKRGLIAAMDEATDERYAMFFARLTAIRSHPAQSIRPSRPLLMNVADHRIMGTVTIVGRAQSASHGISWEDLIRLRLQPQMRLDPRISLCFKRITHVCARGTGWRRWAKREANTYRKPRIPMDGRELAYEL